MFDHRTIHLLLYVLTHDQAHIPLACLDDHLALLLQSLKVDDARVSTRGFEMTWKVLPDTILMYVPHRDLGLV